MSHTDYISLLLSNLATQYPDCRPATLNTAFLAGVEAFAWMKDGVTYVGTTGKTLREVKAEVNAMTVSKKTFGGRI